MATLITAQGGANNTMSLDHVGFVHGRRFAVYAEVVDYIDLDDEEFTAGALLECEARRLDGSKHGWWIDIGSERIPKFADRLRSQTQVLWRPTLDTGQWELVLRINGRTVATREVECTEGHR
jgi:hypothetical protein